MTPLYGAHIHDGIGYSKNADAAWYRGERPRCAPDWGGRMNSTCKHHVEIPDKSMPTGYRRALVMFYSGVSFAKDETTRPKDGFAVVSEYGNILSFHGAMSDTQIAFDKQSKHNGATYIVPAKIIPTGSPIYPNQEEMK